VVHDPDAEAGTILQVVRPVCSTDEHQLRSAAVVVVKVADGRPIGISTRSWCAAEAAQDEIQRPSVPIGWQVPIPPFRHRAGY
jgi:hypothetical protein